MATFQPQTSLPVCGIWFPRCQLSLEAVLKFTQTILQLFSYIPNWRSPLPNWSRPDIAPLGFSDTKAPLHKIQAPSTYVSAERGSNTGSTMDAHVAGLASKIIQPPTRELKIKSPNLLGAWKLALTKHRKLMRWILKIHSNYKWMCAVLIFGLKHASNPALAGIQTCSFNSQHLSRASHVSSPMLSMC